MAKSNNSNVKETSPPADVAAKGTAIFINNYPRTLCHNRSSSSTGKSFYSVAFRYGDNWASLPLPASMVRASTKRDGTELEKCFNLFLGQSDEKRTISVQKSYGVYEKVRMTCSEIKQAITEAREAYAAEIA